MKIGNININPVIPNHGYDISERYAGTAGVWRITALNEAGGWKDRTTVEDMDLAVRASLRGWKFVYVSDLKVIKFARILTVLRKHQEVSTKFSFLSLQVRNYYLKPFCIYSRGNTNTIVGKMNINSITNLPK